MDNPIIPNPWILRPITTVYIPIFKAKKSTLRSQAEVEAEVVCSEYNLITCFLWGHFFFVSIWDHIEKKKFFWNSDNGLYSACYILMGLILYTLEGGQWIRKKSLAAKNKISLPEERNLPLNKKIRKKEKKDWIEKYSSGNIKINTLNIIIILVLNWHAFEIQISNEMEWYEIN